MASADKWQVSASVLALTDAQKTAALQFLAGCDPDATAAAIAYAQRQVPGSSGAADAIA
jgi:hypothetical protein